MFQFNTPSPHMQNYKQCVVSFVSSIYSSLLLSKENEGEKPLADWTNSVNLLVVDCFPKRKMTAVIQKDKLVFAKFYSTFSTLKCPIALLYPCQTSAEAMEN